MTEEEMDAKEKTPPAESSPTKQQEHVTTLKENEGDKNEKENGVTEQQNEKMKEQCGELEEGDKMVDENCVEEQEKDVDEMFEESGETTDTSSEKANESKDYFDDDELFQCLDCKIKECVMWRKCNDKQGVICNLCHLERVKSESTASQGGPANNPTNSTTSTTSSNGKTTSSSQMQPPIKAKDVRISKRKNKQNKKFTNGFYGDRIIKSNHSKSRRSLYKRKPMKSALGSSAIVASQSIYHNGLLYRVGDVVCTSDIEGGPTYYAQLRGFLQDSYCEKSAIITWLIPTKRNLSSFDPMLFVPGLDEETPRPMSCFAFVCRASTTLFKSPNMHPPYKRSQCDLNNLIHVANAMNTNEEATGSTEQTTEGES